MRRQAKRMVARLFHIISFINMKKLLVFAVSLFSSMATMAYDFESNGFYYNILSLSDLTAQVTCKGAEDEYEGYIASYSGDITIPSTVEYAGRTFTVTSINEYAFQECSIRTLTIPASVTRISKKNSSGNQELSGLRGGFINLIVEDSDTPIECFRSIIYFGSLTGSAYIGRNIAGAQSGGVTHYGGGYTSITFGNKVTYLDRTCANCQELTTVTLPESIKKVNCAFVGCESLKSVTAPGVEYINGAFIGCTSLETVDIPNLRIIENEAFKGCESLKNYVVPQCVVKIDGAVFRNCTGLESVTLPSTLVELGKENGSTFMSCTALKEIVVSNPLPINIAETTFDAATYINATLKVPVGSLEAYKNADSWKNFFNIVEDASIASDIYTLVVDNDIECGEIAVEGEEVQPQYQDKNEYSDYIYATYRFLRKGSPLKITVTPDFNYILQALYVNGVNVTGDVVDNVYNTTVTGNMNISAEFGYTDDPRPEPDMILTMKQADNGIMKMKFSKYDGCEIAVAPCDGWKIHSVTLDGEDVTNEFANEDNYYYIYMNKDRELVVVYATASEGVEAVTSAATAVRVTGYAGNITVSNAEAGESISIFTTEGKLVVTSIAQGGASTIRVPENEVYIVKVGRSTFKVGL